MSESEREHALRLTPDRALEALDEAAGWIEERGMATLMPDCSLPSLFAACHEEPYAAGKRGFAQWPKTKWWWAAALAKRPGITQLRIHRGKSLLVSERVARLADPLCRAALAEAERGPYAPLLAHLAEAGPSLIDELKEELGLDPRSLKRARDTLERAGAVVARGVVLEPHRHTTELRRWDQAFPEPSPGGIDELVVAGVEAAVIAPEREIPTWFTWPADGAVERLVEAGGLVRLEGGIACA
jgi:hypothetical protein